MDDGRISCEDALSQPKEYLSFGFDDGRILERLNFSDTFEYLSRQGFGDNFLTGARKRSLEHLLYGGYKDPDAHQCDYCGKDLMGIEYEVLKDGRERCIDCSSTAVKTQSDFEMALAQTREGMCLKYGIELNCPIKVKVVSQARMSRLTGDVFVPTKNFDPRAVGMAVNAHGRYTMYFENGTPKASLIATIAHELTHIWQYENWDMKGKERELGNLFLPVVEGMAKWSEIQYMYLLNETDFADAHLANEIAREDVYGYGLKMMLNEYQLTKDVVLSGATPFDA